MFSTDELLRRPSRPPNYAAENQALVALAQEMATSPEGILQSLADTALSLCRAHSAGLSLLEDGDQKSNFHWRSIAGQWAPHVNGGTPRNFGPCGTVLDHDVAMLCSHPELDFPYLAPIKPVLEEGLLIPFYIKGEAVGTIWVIAHDTSRRFDAEDLRVMTTLGTFAAAAYQAMLSLNATQRSASIVESSDDAIISKNLNGIITTWNKGAQRIFGYSAEEVIGKPVMVLVPPDRHDEETNILERIRRSERVEHYETVRQGKYGNRIDISLTVSPVRNVEGKVVGASKIARDITEEKRAEQRLRESEARLQAAVDLVKLGRYEWNPQTNELRWDDTLKAMWGLPAGAPVDYDLWRACVQPDDLALVEAEIQRCTDPRGDGVFDIEYRVVGKTDGVERWIATRGQTNFENHVPVSFHGVALDVTHRKNIERTLERRVEARTHELEKVNRRLRAQIEQREFAEAEVQQLQRLDAIGQTTSGVAHDFNNLLTVVLTNARLLARNVRDPYDREGVELIRTAAERGANLIAQLLAFSRKQRLEPQEVDLNSKIVGMSDLLSATLGSTVQLRTVLSADLWPALVDPTQIELIILNLAINARDAMGSGGILTLETFNAVIDDGPFGPQEPVPGRYVGLAVNDTGVGIPDDVLPRVFEPFFTTKEGGKGSGLGLPQVFGFAKQSGGGVGIETRVGEGTSVKAFLPRAEVAVRDRERESVDAEPGPRTEMTVRILVVDDDGAVLRTTLRMLDALGYATVPAASGGEALALIANGPKIDLVLADFAMPEMTGVELAETIHTTCPALPVILVTGYGNREALKDFGEARILHKPYTEDELKKKIASALTKDDLRQ
jgi:PAS domain S-box-containing protein